MPDESAPAKPSAVEVFKTDSDYLKGDIPEELTDGEAGFGKGSIQLLKNHGTYQQADRDKKKLAPGEKRVKENLFHDSYKNSWGETYGFTDAGAN